MTSASGPSLSPSAPPPLPVVALMQGAWQSVVSPIDLQLRTVQRIGTAATHNMTVKPYRVFDNCMATIHDLASRAEIWQSRPSWLEFVPNNVCNLRCVMCAQSDGVPVVSMPRSESEPLLDQLGQTVTMWTPMALSEPLANDFRFIVDQARKQDIWLNVYTNAMLLTGPRFEMMADRLHKLHISFDSHVPAVYESVRVGARFETTLANIKAVLPLARKHGIPVCFVAVLMVDNAPHLADYMDFLADLGAAENGCEVGLLSLLDGSTGCTIRKVTDHYTSAEVEGFLDRACDRARARNLTFVTSLEEPFTRTVLGNPAPPTRSTLVDMLGKAVARIQRDYPGFCGMASYYIKIHPSGNVHPCCREPRELTMGNVKHQSLEEIWNGPKYRDFRRRMFAGDYPDCCKNCYLLTGNPHFQARQAPPAAGRA